MITNSPMILRSCNQRKRLWVKKLILTMLLIFRNTRQIIVENRYNFQTTINKCIERPDHINFKIFITSFYISLVELLLCCTQLYAMGIPQFYILSITTLLSRAWHNSCRNKLFYHFDKISTFVKFLSSFWRCCQGFLNNFNK